MTVLVTGGAGFIGSHLTLRLLDEGYAVVVLDNLDDNYDNTLKERNIRACDSASESASFEFIDGSINDPNVLDELLGTNDVEVVFHEAAKPNIRKSIKEPNKTKETNVDGTLTVLESAVENGVDRVINASSASIYGQMEYFPAHEDDAPNPLNPYAESKFAAECYCREFAERYDLRTINLRYFTVYGPRMRPDTAITNFTSRCFRGEPIIVYGDGTQTRDFTHVEDVVEANLLALDSSVEGHELINISSTESLSINRLAELIIARSGSDSEILYETFKDGDHRHAHADISKATELLGFSPEVSNVVRGISAFVDWYRANRDWYEPIMTRRGGAEGDRIPHQA